MPKELINPDVDLSREFSELEEDQRVKERIRENHKKALWAFEALVDEGLLTDQSSYKEVLEVTRRRIKELKQTEEHAEGVKKEEYGSDEGREFQKVAEEEAIKAYKLLTNLYEAERLLTFLNKHDFNQGQTLADIRKNFQTLLEGMEQEVIDDEERRRSQNR